MTELLDDMELALTDLIQSGFSTGGPAAAQRLGGLARLCEDRGLHTGSALLSRLERALTARSHRVEKEYQVRVAGDVDRALPVLRAPVEDGGEILTADRVERTGDHTLTVVIHQGKNRQVRRMCAAAGLTVERLRRVREGRVLLGSLKPGSWRPLTPEELGFLQD